MIPFDKREQAIADIERSIAVLEKLAVMQVADAIAALRRFKAHFESMSGSTRVEIERLLDEFNVAVEADRRLAAARRVVLEDDLIRISIQGLKHYEALSREKMLSEVERRQKAVLETEIFCSKERVREELEIIANDAW